MYKEYLEQRIKEIILYILSKTDVTSYYKLMKILFCADRQNLVKYGSTITNLKYKALEHGPVPENLYSEIKGLQSGGSSNLSDIMNFVSKYYVSPKRNPNIDYLSKADKISLDKAIEELGDMDYKQTESYLHDDIYKKVVNTKDKVYTVEDIAKSGHATDEMLNYIQMQAETAKMLL